MIMLKKTEKETDLSRIEELEKQINISRGELIDLKRKYQLDIFCCRKSENSNGWHHNDNCKNWVLTY